jgi:hypothetical protein
MTVQTVRRWATRVADTLLLPMWLLVLAVLLIAVMIAVGLGRVFSTPDPWAGE